MQNHPGNGVLEEFRIEFLDCWRQLPNKGFFFGLLAAWVALFQFVGNSVLGYGATSSLMDWMYKAYGGGLGRNLFDSEDWYGLFVPLIVLVFFWLKRRTLLAVPVRLWAPGLWLLGLGLVIHVLGYLVQQPRISIAGLVAGIYGLMGLAWGPVWLRTSFFPFAFLIFCVPLGSLGQAITFELRLFVTKIVAFVSNYILAINVARRGTELIDPTGAFQYEVAAACSGIKSLAVTVVFAVLIGYLSFPAWWKRLSLVAAAVPLAVMSNVVRLLAIVIAAEMGGKAWGDWVHENEVVSLVPYVIAFAGLFWIARRLEGRRNAPASQSPSTPTCPGEQASAKSGTAGENTL